MRRIRKRFLVSIGCAAIVMALLLTAVLTTHLLANREMVRSFIVSKTARATGGVLVYDRLDISFFPLPHLRVRGIQLRRPHAFAVQAHELSVYPRISAILAGQISIHRLVLIAPAIQVHLGSTPLEEPASPKNQEGRSLEDSIRTVIGGTFGGLAAIDPGTELRIESGSATLSFSDAPDILITGIHAVVENSDGDLSLNGHCQSDLTGNLNVHAKADIATTQASGQITLTDLNVRPLLLHATLPAGITAENTRARFTATVKVDGPETMHGRFDLRFPSLTVLRKGLKLAFDTAAISGNVDYADQSLSLSNVSFESVQPALNLAAAAVIQPTGAAGGSVIDVHATTGELDVAVAAAVTRAIAGDLDEIRTAFGMAKEGRLTDAAYFAKLATGGEGLQLTQMKASGRLAQGRITIPGIRADLENLAVDVTFEDQHVAFKNASGHFKGAAFKGLDAAIDWQKEPILSISSSSVAVDAAPLYTWLTGFKGLDEAKKVIDSINGTLRITQLEIDGPLTAPATWSFKIAVTPENIRLISPLVPFAVRLSGGVITYLPGEAQSTGVSFDFLDGSFVSSYQFKGIPNPESATCRIDGSMGEKTIAWLGTLLPIPKHLQLSPPVDLSGVTIAWNDTRELAFMGAIKTAGGVELFADFTVSPQDWAIRQIQFADGSSRATVSARNHPDGIEVDFSGNVEKITADHLLENNQTLSGRLVGDFHAVIDTHAPLNSSFTGKLAGEGLHILSLISNPIDVNHFCMDGSNGQLMIAPSEVSLCSSLLVVDGVVDNHAGKLVFNLNVDADRLNEELIQALEPIDKRNANTAEQTTAESVAGPIGEIHLKAADLTYGGFTWSQVDADVRIDGSATDVQVHQANLCGITTIGALKFSPQGVSLHVTPMATGASLQETADCLWQKPVKAKAQYDLAGEINLPATQANVIQSMTGRMTFSSENGRIQYANVLMQIFSVLNVTEVFAGGKSDLTEEGYGYTKASVNAAIGDGKLQLEEILLDGNSLKITGQGSIDLQDQTVDIMLLAAPLKTVDRIVNTIPIIGYIAGGSLISIPIRVHGKMKALAVVPMPAAAVGQGLLKIMERTLKAPFKLVESAVGFASSESSVTEIPPAKTPPERP